MTVTEAKLKATKTNQPQPYAQKVFDRVTVFFTNRLNANFDGVQCQVGFDFHFPFMPNDNKPKFVGYSYYEDGSDVTTKCSISTIPADKFPHNLVEDMAEFAKYWICLQFDLKVAALSFEQSYPDRKLKKFSYNARNDHFYFSYEDEDGNHQLLVIKRFKWFELITDRVFESEQTQHFFSWNNCNLTLHHELTAVMFLIAMPNWIPDDYIDYPIVGDFQLLGSGTALDYWRQIRKYPKKYRYGYNDGASDSSKAKSSDFHKLVPTTKTTKKKVRGFA